MREREKEGRSWGVRKEVREEGREENACGFCILINPPSLETGEQYETGHFLQGHFDCTFFLFV